MNERIREVWIKAAREDSDPDNWDTQEQFIERFAELIVKECAGVARQHILERHGMSTDYAGKVLVEETIKNHFKEQQ